MGGRRGAQLKRRASTILGVAAIAAFASCFDMSTRWETAPPAPAPPACTLGEVRCGGGALERCDTVAGAAAWAIIDDCPAQGLVCAPSLLTCKTCIPSQPFCDEQDVMSCDASGDVATFVETCVPATGVACRAGGCVDLCAQAGVVKSNVGCEYWAVDLDNAKISATSNAAAQQFAVVISNAQPDVASEIRIYQDDGQPGDDPAPVEIASAVIAPLNLQVFKLGPREVDGTPDGTYNEGTHTALTRHAFKITSSFPVVAYQFNPLENANVFSNDASLLKPREALTYDGDGLTKAYVVVGWPQTIAATDDPNTNFNPLRPIHLRAFLTIVGTREDTQVRVTTKTAVVGGGPVAETPANGVIDATLGAFDVLNLETGDFNADFTGSIIEASGPIAVFSGNEASDAPWFVTLATRRCCADHMEDQLDPIRTAGKLFAIPHTPNRSAAVAAAGADIGIVAEPEYIRFVAATSKGAKIKTTLPPPADTIDLLYQGDWREVTVLTDFMAESSEPVMVAQIMSSQDASGVKRGLPGGDPSLVIMPPIEQFRPNYVFLTPDKYAFDFVSIVAPPQATVLLDDVLLSSAECEVTPADGLTEEERGSATPPFIVYRCPLAFPIIDPLLTAPDNVLPGVQNDGVHRLVSDYPLGVEVTGFDSYVSYGYAAGTELREITAPD
jgi:hypothetical protein